ncbi:MAG: P-loop NTPase [Nitrospirota bacterium]|nr:P-loop NTPase [Nitrospirota bacterium]
MNTFEPKTLLALALLGIKRHKLIGLLTFLLILVPVLAVGMMKKPIYVSKATVYLKANNYSTSSLDNRIHPPRSLGIQLAILKSAYLAQKVVAALPDETLRDLEANAEYTDYETKFLNLIRTTLDKPPIVVSPQEKASLELRNARMNFRGAGYGGIIEISAESQDPKVSRDLVNAYIDVFKEISSNFATAQQADLDKSLSLQILNARSLLKKSEEDLMAFQNKNRVKGRSHNEIDVGNYFAQETALLSTLKARRANLLLTETESHPDVVGISEQISEIKRKLHTLNHMASPKGGRIDVSGPEWENFLEENVKMDKDLMGELEQERSSVRIIADSNLENMVVIDPPTIPAVPKMAKGLRVMILGIFMSFAGSVGVPFLFVFFRKPVLGEENLRALSALPNLASIPKIPRKIVPERNGSKILRVDHPVGAPEFWAFQKSFETLYFRLRQLSKTEKDQVILFTSQTSGEGKTLSATNLALTMAAWGNRVILFDIDHVRGNLAGSMNLQNRYTVEAFFRPGDVTPPMIAWDQSNLATVSLGDFGADFWRTTQDSVLFKGFELLRYQANFILIDAPPILAAPDLLSLSAYVDGTILVARNTQSLEKEILKTESALKEHHFKILGTILNESNETRASYYSTYGYAPKTVVRE